MNSVHRKLSLPKLLVCHVNINIVPVQLVSS